MQHNKRERHEFHGLILPHFCYSQSKIAIIPTIFIGKHVKLSEIGLETMVWEGINEWIWRILAPESKNSPKIIGSNFSTF